MDTYIIMRLMSCVVFTAAPSQALVDRVRDLYHKRVSDVRFLIPVLTGLSKVCTAARCRTPHCMVLGELISYAPSTDIVSAAIKIKCAALPSAE